MMRKAVKLSISNDKPKLDVVYEKQILQKNIVHLEHPVEHNRKHKVFRKAPKGFPSTATVDKSSNKTNFGR
ncbi:hypothetical protein T265_11615 [Opisthorchis viverrini]|uniref:Uncharacterized protein n=1 Tax=Opisthorchis viverrini TaxID=6198 RepID=A0A074Z2G1_OPIVI|nr:hypothetical protein T265_11615 [Opisthorchis viverrini]KER19677.1 hypothetical protein T265_11615 [Opisthorchis viverrini]